MDSFQIVVLGAGESGVGAARLAQHHGLKVFVSDRGFIAERHKAELNKYQIPFEEQKHSEEIIFQAQEVIKSPGIPDKVPLIQSLRAKSIPIVSEIEFAARYTQATLIAITGTNGKTTTTSLSHHLLKGAGLSAQAAGNIGNSFAREVIEDAYDFYILEISSFQLDDIERFHPHIAVILNISPDHLDRYKNDLALYAQSKLNIFRNQESQDHFIYNAQSAFIVEKIQSLSSPPQLYPVNLSNPNHSIAFLASNFLKVDDFQIPLAQMALQGPHNYFNSAVAIKIAQLLGLSSEDIAEGLRTFVNVPHRLEKVGVLRDVSYINDSKATNVEAVFYALQSFDKPIIWIAGGIDKGNDYDLIASLVKQKVKAFISLGKDNQRLENYFKDKLANIHQVPSMEEALRLAQSLAHPNEVVLLSPACASFDLFKNYIDRGNRFKEIYQKLT